MWLQSSTVANLDCVVFDWMLIIMPEVLIVEFIVVHQVCRRCCINSIAKYTHDKGVSII